MGFALDVEKVAELILAPSSHLPHRVSPLALVIVQEGVLVVEHGLVLDDDLLAWRVHHDVQVVQEEENELLVLD